MVLGAPFSTGVDIGATDTGWVGSPGVFSGGDVSEGARDNVEGLELMMVVLKGGPGCVGLVSTGF